ncbi:MAG: fibronectin type III domain-containing protein [Methylococcaceae bacterium]|nr:fibronectin type III domain-containing protein [Methylococcaceae bacterium]
MATFPSRESDITVLAQAIIQGLNTQSANFPKSPYSATEIQAQLNAYFGLRDTLTALQAQVAEAAAAKQDGLNRLTDGLKAVLRYVEHAATGEEQLAAFGWSGRRAPTALQPPGQCRNLEAPRQGEGWAFLDWKEPAEGGKPSFYTVEIREAPDGEWKHAATTVESEATLVNLPRGKNLECRVFAANKAGNGPVSNTVSLVV